MTYYTTRKMATGLAVSVVSLLLQHVCPTSVTAQLTQNEPEPVVEVPIQRLNQIQEELRYLRTRDAERQAWEDSIASRLPATGFETVGHRHVSD